MSGPLYELALSVPWCCTSEALEAILAIAAREPIDADELARRMHGPKSLALRNGQRRDDSRAMTMLGSVARIPIDGPIYRYADFFTSLSGGVTTESLARDLQTALDDVAVSGIVLVIDSPGGEATAINELADTIHAARAKKPIVAYIEGYGASAAYWIASAASMVLVDDSALVGSIGTVLGVPDPTKRPSTRIDIVSTQSPKKRPNVLTDEGRAVLQQIADDMTEVFIAKVMRNRGITREQILAVQGGLLVGQQAIDAGLADMLGSEEGALRMLASGDIGAFLPPPARQPILPLLGGQSAAKEHKPMAKGFWAWMGGADETPATPPPALASEPLARIESAAAALQPPQSSADDDRAAKIKAENDQLQKQLSELRARQIMSEAEQFTKEQIAAGHAFPVEQAQLMALYTRAAQDDLAHPITAEGDAAASSTSRVQLLRAAVEARPANQLSRQLIASAPAGAVALPSSNTGADPYAEDEASARSYAEKANGSRAK